jgi:hypothetical protein
MTDPFPTRPKKPLPYPFVLDALADVITETKPMFGSLALYVHDKIVLILREKRDSSPDDGVWLATAAEHHESLRREFPNMRSIAVFGLHVTHWQVLAADTPDFEEAVLRACELIAARDLRIGRVPKSRSSGSRPVKQRPSGSRRKP